MHDDVVEVVSDGLTVVDDTEVAGALVRSPVEGAGDVVGSGVAIGDGPGVARVVVTGAGVGAVAGALVRDTRFCATGAEFRHIGKLLSYC